MNLIKNKYAIRFTSNYIGEHAPIQIRVACTNCLQCIMVDGSLHHIVDFIQKHECPPCVVGPNELRSNIKDLFQNLVDSVNC